MKVGSLCTGYGGIELGLKLAGEDVDLRWLAESDRALDVLHPLGVPNLGDITTVDWATIESVDLLTAGFPCQPVSAAGSQLAEADPRWLWPAVHRAIAALKPERVLLENVRNLISTRKGELWRGILDDLANLGYDVTWLTLGACAIGAAHHRHRVFALATHTQWSEPRVTRLDVQECGAPRRAIEWPKSVDLLPTPAARDGDGRGEGDAAHWAEHRRSNGIPLAAELALLPTPSASESSGAGHAAQGGLNLRTTVALLPTPRAPDGVGGPGQRGSSGDLAMPSAVQPEHWGRFAAAVQRHAAIFGPPPPPTEPNRNGAPRLSPAFAEWLMCIPAGHVTDVLPRTAALKAIGNGVCPPQLAQAWRYLTNQHPVSVDRPSDMSIGFGAMTSSTTTSQDVKDIQDRQSAGRGAVIDATNKMRYSINNGHGLDDGPEIAAVIEAAMMALVEHWRGEADIWEASKKRGGIGTAKELRQAASRLAGFAIGLTTRPVATNAERVANMAETWDQALTQTSEDALVLLDDIVDALPIGDPVVAVFEPPLDDLAEATAEHERIEMHELRRSEEQSLRDIIGPLGASATALVDNPFTRPNVPWLNRAPVDVIPYQNLPIIAAATAPRDHVSHSYVESYESCSLAAMLRDASRAGHIGALRPSWSTIAGSAFHAAVETIERAALVNVLISETIDPDLEAFWMSFFDAQIKEQLAALVGTPYADSGTWYVANRGREGFDWWRVEGARMLKLYLDYHTPAWRAANQTFLLQDKTPVIEFEYDMTIRSLDQERGLRAKGFIDRAILNMETYSLTVLDYKTGSREPDSTFQLGEYGHALLMAMGIPQEPADRPILGQYWLARKGIYTTAVPVLQRHPMSELQYRYDQAARGNKAGIFAPHVSNFCIRCSAAAYCPTQAGRS